MTALDKGASKSAPAFCPHCGTILDLVEANSIVCGACAHSCQYQGRYSSIYASRAGTFTHTIFLLLVDLPSLTYVSYSEKKPAPAWLNRAKLGSSEVKGPARATVEEACPKCNHPQMEFYTMQLRSADEGQTVFYECRKCGHKYSVNT